MADPKDLQVIIHTSGEGWVKQVAEAYRMRKPIILEDDAHVGVDPRKDTLLQMGVKADLSRREWSGVLISLGLAGVGLWLVVMAVLDPEPFSKVAVAIVAGAVLLACTQSPGSRIIEIQMRTMAEALA